METTTQELKVFRKQFMPTIIYRLVKIETEPEIIEVPYRSITETPFGVEFDLYHTSYFEREEVKTLTVNINETISGLNYFIDRTKAYAALYEALEKRIAELTKQNKDRSERIKMYEEIISKGQEATVK